MAFGNNATARGGSKHNGMNRGGNRGGSSLRGTNRGGGRSPRGNFRGGKNQRMNRFKDDNENSFHGNQRNFRGGRGGGRFRGSRGGGFNRNFDNDSKSSYKQNKFFKKIDDEVEDENESLASKELNDSDISSDEEVSMQQNQKYNGILKNKDGKAAENKAVAQLDESDDDDLSDSVMNSEDSDDDDNESVDSDDSNDSSIDEKSSKPNNFADLTKHQKNAVKKDSTNKSSTAFKKIKTNEATIQKKQRHQYDDNDEKEENDDDVDDGSTDEDDEDELDSDNSQDEVDENEDYSDDEDQVVPQKKQRLINETDIKKPKSILKKTKTSELTNDIVLETSTNKLEKSAMLNMSKQNNANVKTKINNAASKKVSKQLNTTTENKITKIDYNNTQQSDNNLPSDNELFLKKVDVKSPECSTKFSNAIIVRKMPITFSEQELRKLAPDANQFGYVGFKSVQVSVIFNFPNDKAANAFMNKINGQTIGDKFNKVQAARFVTVALENVNPLSIFIGNVPIESSKESLDSIFPENKSITLIRRVKKGGTHKVAFAFIEFNDPEIVKKYIAMHQKIKLDGNALNIRAAFYRDAVTTQQGAHSELDLKALYVGNLPLDITSDQLNNLFSTANKVVLSAPIKNIKGHMRPRFAFAYFNSEAECAESLKANVLATINGRQLAVSFKSLSKASISAQDLNSSSISLDNNPKASIAQKRKITSNENNPTNSKKQSKKLTMDEVKATSKLPKIDDTYEDDEEDDDVDDDEGVDDADDNVDSDEDDDDIDDDDDVDDDDGDEEEDDEEDE